MDAPIPNSPCPLRLRHTVLTVLATALLAGCASAPPLPHRVDADPQLRLPAVHGAGQDRRGRFREVFCAVLDARKDALPDHRACDLALTRLEPEPPGTGAGVELGTVERKLTLLFVPGVGWDCFADWLAMEDTIPRHLGQFGFDMRTVPIDGLGSSASNAVRIRDSVLAMPRDDSGPHLVLMGYSKGAVDIQVALARHPEIHHRVAAVVSLAGVIGGSPLAEAMGEDELDMLQYFPGARCTPVDGGVINDIRPATRRAWLDSHPLPPGIAYYSLITVPAPGQVSRVLRSSYKTLALTDPNNDSQVILADQYLPGSALLGLLNADHWAVAVPIARTHGMVGTLLVNRNVYPREALYEALMRLIAEDVRQADTRLAR
ncbi:MAG TPA: hypothetical protein PLM62_12020 [Zoogloea sp.]|nr:hypothetical protein [Zoogloea sp.]